MSSVDRESHGVDMRFVFISALLAIVAVATMASAIVDLQNRRDAQRAAEAVDEAIR